MFAQLTHATYLEPTYVPTTMRQHTPNLFSAGTRDGGCVASLCTYVHVSVCVHHCARVNSLTDCNVYAVGPRGFDRSAEEGYPTAVMGGECRRVECKFARK